MIIVPLKNAISENTNLEKVDFRNAKNLKIDPDCNRLKGAKFSIDNAIRLLDKYNITIG